MNKLNMTAILIVACLAFSVGALAQDMSKKGPVPTKIDFEKNPNIVLDGKPLEVGSKKEVFDANFQMNVIKLEGKTQFVQKVKVVGDAASISGKLEFMTCNGQMCMPPAKVNFNVPLGQ